MIAFLFLIPSIVNQQFAILDIIVLGAATAILPMYKTFSKTKRDKDILVASHQINHKRQNLFKTKSERVYGLKESSQPHLKMNSKHFLILEAGLSVLTIIGSILCIFI